MSYNFYSGRVFLPGEYVWLDRGYSNASQVIVIKQTPQRLYTTVRDELNNEWVVMTYRLTPENSNTKE